MSNPFFNFRGEKAGPEQKITFMGQIEAKLIHNSQFIIHNFDQ
jgi:hypothetical protein